MRVQGAGRWAGTRRLVIGLMVLAMVSGCSAGDEAVDLAAMLPQVPADMRESVWAVDLKAGSPLDYVYLDRSLPFFVAEDCDVFAEASEHFGDPTWGVEWSLGNLAPHDQAALDLTLQAWPHDPSERATWVAERIEPCVRSALPAWIESTFVGAQFKDLNVLETRNIDIADRPATARTFRADYQFGEVDLPVYQHIVYAPTGRLLFVFNFVRPMTPIEEPSIDRMVRFSIDEVTSHIGMGP